MHRQFETTKQQHQNRLYSYAWYSLRIAEDAEDVVQEAFIRLWENWSSVDPLQAGAWLMRVTRNLIIDHVRRQKTRIPTSDIDADEVTLDDDTSHHEQQKHQEILQQIVEQSIARLNDPYRTTLILREIQGLSYQEIADILCISADQVRTDLFRGKGKLREIVKQHPRYHTELLTG